MNPLSDKQIRMSFTNASRREANQAILPDLDAVDWENLDYLGWRDAKRPQLAYVVLERDGEPAGVLLRSVPRPERRRAMVCVWCEDVVVTDDVSMYIARRAGASGRRGNTIGTLICTELICSQNVRRKPTVSEVGSDDDADRQRLVERRIEGLRKRSARFIDQVSNG
ncbi:FBP domain-containing protein [Luteipulveratus sp. YIM 133296]|uniref:FBP domain-containing protein n=2 Tax=Luteipulveratus flavus TaxID=3031728 RepID=A0ABT6CDH7_9MICO|nr:FBP domain-containing protein [Luteipulveratus sp. YIM 133296]MDF8266079.1 FBP domain-containing protein [Luteipulveratus sp. YIM 133296]